MSYYPIKTKLKKILNIQSEISYEDEVKKICDVYKIKDWSINSDGLVDVDSSVYLDANNQFPNRLEQKNYGHLLKKLPLKFGTINGHFDCNSNILTSLEGAPHTVGGHFDCNYNNLTSLEGAPHNVGGDFYCNYNNLTSLEGAPHNVGGDFYCNANDLTSLEGAPKTVGGGFYCKCNNLTSLEGCPDTLTILDCSLNNIYLLEGIPRHMDKFYYGINNPISGIFSLIKNNKLNTQIIDLLIDYDCVRGNEIILDRFNDFLEEIGLKPVESVKHYKMI